MVNWDEYSKKEDTGEKRIKIVSEIDDFYIPDYFKFEY
jgi:hypothetical protein